VTHQLHEPAHLGPRDCQTEAGDVIVPPTLVVGARAALFHFDDQPLLDHARHRAIQRARAQPELAVGARFDVLHDRVAVTVRLGQRQQDVQRGRGKGEQLFWR
jgi:hypothetical protein